MGDKTRDGPNPDPGIGALDDLDSLFSKAGRSNTVFDPQPEGTEKTVFDPNAPLADSSPQAANEPRRALAPSPAAASLALPAGFRLHEYRIDSLLGQGGLGIAYAETDAERCHRRGRAGERRLQQSDLGGVAPTGTDPTEKGVGGGRGGRPIELYAGGAPLCRLTTVRTPGAAPSRSSAERKLIAAPSP